MTHVFQIATLTRVMRQRTRTASYTLIALAATILGSCDKPAPPPKVTQIIPGSVMHGVEGLALTPDGTIYGASYFGQSIYKIDPKSGRVEIAVGSPDGEGDDVAIGPQNTPAAGIIAWTAVESVHSLTPDGVHHVLVAHAPRANPIAFSKEGRLFFSQSGTPDNELWEIDPLGVKPARLVTKGQGPLNGFDFGPDGRIYAPLFGTDQVVAIDVETGVYTVIAKGVGSPAAVRVDPKGNLVAVDYKLGDIWYIDRNTGETRKLGNAPPVIDNLAIAPDGTAYLAATADSTIYAMNLETGEIRDLVRGKFITPLGATFTTFKGKPTLLIAQPQGYIYVDPATGETSRPFYDAGRNASNSVAADERTIVTALPGRLRKIDRASDMIVLQTTEIKTPAGVLIGPQGDVLVADTASGRILSWTETGITAIAEGLSQPTAMVLETPTTVLVAETEAGQITRVELDNGQRTVVLKGLDHPLGLALMKDGGIAVAEPAKGTVAAFNPKTGARSELAAKLPLSLAGQRISQTTPTGMVTGADGMLYVAGAADNSLWKISISQK